MKLGTARITVWSLMAAAVLFGLTALLSQSPVAYVLTGLALAAELIVFYAFIKCPHCGSHAMKQVGRCKDYYTLGLYECPVCDRKK